MRTEFSSACHAGRRGEDRVVATRLKWQLAGQACHLFAVFDGHGGSAASRCCAAHVAAIAEALLASAAHPAVASPIELAGQLQQAAVMTCLELQRAFAASGRGSGCTVTLVLQAGRLVTVASLGSSRCVLDTGCGGLATLSMQHVISTNPQERQRLQAAGCHVAPQEPGSSSPAASPRASGGVLRLWPGGLTMSRAIGDFAIGEGVLPLPHVKQVLLPPSGGRLVLASDGVWSQAGERLSHIMRSAPIRSAALDVVRAAAVSSGGSNSVDASAVIADVLEPGSTWRNSTLEAAAVQPKGTVPGQRALGLLRKLSLGRRQTLADAAEGAESPTQREGLLQAELLADYDTAALLGLLPSSSRPQAPARLGSSSSGSSLSSALWAVGSSSFGASRSSSFGASRSSSFSRSGSSTPVSEDAGLLREKEGCRLRPAWWDDAMGLVACKMMADARALWSAKARSRQHSAPATPTATEGLPPGKQAQWGGRTQGSWWLHALASSMAAPN